MSQIKVVTIEVEELKKILTELMGKESEKEEMLTTDQVAKMLNVDRGTVYDWRDSGLLKAYSMPKSRRVWFKRSELMASMIRINGDKAA